MLRKLLSFLPLLLVLATPLGAQDVLTLGSEIGSAGSTVSIPIPISILDRSGTPLGIDAGSPNRIQGFSFKVLYRTEAISSIAFTRAGVASIVTPRYDTALQGSGWSSAIVSFDESTDPLPLHLNAPAPGDRVGTLTVTLRADAPAGSSIALTLHAPSAMLANEAGTTQETVANGQLALVNGKVDVSAVQAPTNLVATASSTTQVNLTWNAVAGADQYQVWRSQDGIAFTLLASPTAASYVDSTVSANTSYVYRVRTIDAATPSGYSNIDVATTVIFTDDPLVALSTKVKAVHFTELRTAVNAMLTAAGRPTLASDPTVAVGQPVRATHVTDLRNALNAARTVLGLSALTFTDTPPVRIKAVHVQELRNGVK